MLAVLFGGPNCSFYTNGVIDLAGADLLTARKQANPVRTAHCVYLDVLVDPTPETTLLDIGAIRYELKALLGIEVDVLTPNGLPDSFRERVLREAVRL